MTNLRELLTTRFGGVLRRGLHAADGEACALELLSAAQGLAWTDSPARTRTFDLRPLNDMPVDNVTRTTHLLPVLEVYAGSLDWPAERQCAVAQRLAILTVNRLIATLPGLSKEARHACESATTPGAVAKEMSRVSLAAALAAEAAAWAAEGAARAAEWAARAAEWEATWAARAAEGEAEAKERIFISACQLWLEAAQHGKISTSL